MDKILSINTIKNVFSALGAKTSDNNYGVALLDKTSGEPKGLMGMSDLASVLGTFKKPSTISVLDASTLTSTGVYTFSNGLTYGCPTNDGLLIVIVGYNKNMVQVFISSDLNIYSRSRNYWQDDFSAWRKTVTEAIA